MNFSYVGELGAFIQIIILGEILSFVVMYTVEMLKNIIVTKHSYVFAVLCFFISMLFGVLWVLTFAPDTISFLLSIWLGLSLWLGSNGFYHALENSDSALGRTVKSYSEYLKEHNLLTEQEDYEEQKQKNILLIEENNVLVQKLSRADEELSLLKLQIDELKAKLGAQIKDPEKNEEQLSAHFKKKEFQCKCNGVYCDGYPAVVNQHLIEILEAVRVNYNKPVIITSGLRCPQHNAMSGGVVNSKHITGYAADFWFEGMDKSAVIGFLKAQAHYNYAYTNETNMKNAVHIDVK